MGLGQFTDLKGGGMGKKGGVGVGGGGGGGAWYSNAHYVDLQVFFTDFTVQ